MMNAHDRKLQHKEKHAERTSVQISVNNECKDKSDKNIVTHKERKTKA